MTSEPKENSQQGIYAVFSDLLERLNELSFFEGDILFPDSVGDELSFVELDNLSSNLKGFSSVEVSDALDYILNKVEKLLAKGENIVSNISVRVLSPLGMDVSADEDTTKLVRSNLYFCIKTELYYYGSQLTKLMDFIKISQIQQENHGQEQIIDTDYIEKLPKFATAPQEKSVFYPKHTALLFHYLKSNKVFIGNDALPLSKHLHYLTGHSDQNIRKYLSPNEIDLLKNDGHEKLQSGKNKNLSFLKEHLQQVLTDIQKDLDKRS